MVNKTKNQEVLMYDIKNHITNIPKTYKFDDDGNPISAENYFNWADLCIAVLNVKKPDGLTISEMRDYIKAVDSIKNQSNDDVIKLEKEHILLIQQNIPLMKWSIPATIEIVEFGDCIENFEFD